MSDAQPPERAPADPPASSPVDSPVRFEQAGVYQIAADVKRGSQSLARLNRPILVGGADLEMTEPRLNEAVLRRIADTSGGKYVAAADADEILSLIRAADSASPPMEMRDVWENAWTLAMIIALLGAEWVLRRRVGLA